MTLSPHLIENQSLFSDYYLENVFGDRPDIADVFDRADNALEGAGAIYDEEKQSLAGTKEGQTENRFIRPILEDVLDSLDEQDVQLDDFTLLKRLVMKRCIYGVDRNPMAVELAKLSLWLRSFTVGAPLSFLNHHLKPGNSLIGTQVDAVRAALEAEGQQFEVFGGPFAGLLQATELMQEVARLSDATVEEVRESAERFAEYEAAMAPYKWMRANYGEPIRELIEETATARQVIDFGDLPVFEATTYPLILIASTGQNGEAEGVSAHIPHLEFDDLGEMVDEVGVSFTQEHLREMGWALLGNPGFDVLAKIQQDSVRLVEYVGTSPLRGIVSGFNEAFIIDDETRDALIAADSDSKDLLHPVRTGRDVRRYALEDPGTYLLYATHGIDIDQYPAVKEYLRQYKEKLEGRATDQAWYELQQPQEAYEEQFKQPKIINPDLAEKARFHLDRNGIFPTNKIYSLPTDDEYLLAILNSRLSNFYLESTSVQYRGDYLQLLGQYVEDIPIHEIDFTAPEDERERHLEESVEVYEADRDAAVDPVGSATLARVEDHLDADPERADVVHDLLAHLAREMTDLKAERQKLERAFDPFKYLPRRTVSTSFSEAFAEEIKYGALPDAPVDVTRAQHSVEALRLTQDDGNWGLEARLKKRDPDNWQDWQKDDGSIVREWVPVLRFSTLDEKKARFYRFALPHLASFRNEDDDFSGTIIPGGYTRTVKERVWQTPVPVYDSSVDLSDLVGLERELQEADRQLQFTDALIDRIVYRLYGLTDEEVAVVEGRQ